MANEYTKENIRVLEGIEPIKQNPGMYGGELTTPMQLLSEVVDNSVDELEEGKDGEVLVQVDTKENRYTVIDTGRGIPHGKKKLLSGVEKDIIEVLCTEMNSGGKFDSSAYKKSCFTGDTKVKLVDGRDITFEDLLKEYESGKDNFVYSVDNKTHKVIVEKIQNVQLTKKVNKLLEITLDNGGIIKCTEDHIFITRDYDNVEAKHLKVGDSLLPGYFKVTDDTYKTTHWNLSKGYLMIYDQECNEYIPVHVLSDDYNYRNSKIPEYGSNFCRHHIDTNKLNNNPNNILRVPYKDHFKYHTNNKNKLESIYKSYLPKDLYDYYNLDYDRITSNLTELYSDTLTNYNKSDKGRENSRKVGLTTGKKNLLAYVYSEENSIDKHNFMINLNKNPDMIKKQWQSKRLNGEFYRMRSRMQDRNSSPDYQIKCQIGKALKNLHSNNVIVNSENDYNRFRLSDKKYHSLPLFNKVIDYYEGSFEKLNQAISNYNHQVVNIKEVIVDQVDVYDLTVNPKSDNFLLSSGVFVHNCGLHGLGLCLVNALSKELTVTSWRDGEDVTIKFINSEKVDLTCLPCAKSKHGTFVSFIPESKYYDSDIIILQDIEDKLRVLKSFGLGVKLEVDKSEVIIDNKDIYDLMKLEDAKDKVYCQNTFNLSDDKSDMTIALQYNSGARTRQFGYTNYLYNKMGGSHCRVIKNSIQEVWKEFYKEVDIELKDDDCTLGLDILTALFTGFSDIDKVFSSQTKERVVIPTDFYNELVSKFNKQFRKYLIDNEEIRKGLLKRFAEYRLSQNKLLAQKDIKNTVIINQDKSDSIKRKSVVKDLVECTSRNREGTELYIMEGQSAAGPVVRTRNKNLQAVLPLRGKIQNVTGMNIKEVLKHETVVNIINSVGAGVLDQCDADKSRYEKVFLWTDEDSDGYHIKALLLSLFVNVMPDMVKKGRVYIIDCPFYRYEDPSTKETKYCKKQSDIPKGAKDIERFKGIGSMNDEELHDSCLVPGHRIIYRINYPDDIDKFNQIMGSSQGKSDLLKEEGILIDMTGKGDLDGGGEE